MGVNDPCLAASPGLYSIDFPGFACHRAGFAGPVLSEAGEVDTTEARRSPKLGLFRPISIVLAAYKIIFIKMGSAQSADPPKSNQNKEFGGSGPVLGLPGARIRTRLAVQCRLLQ